MKYFALALGFASLLNDAPAHAYVFATNSSGTVLRWSAPVRPEFYANWSNADLLSYSSVFNMLTNSLQRWKYTGSADIDFTYYQGGSNPTSYALDGKNAIFFQSQAPAGQKLGNSTIGITYIYSSSGTIVETDIEFNDESFTFTTNPSHSSNFGTGRNVFLENVATHEFGHAFGLGHSAVLQSSMIYLEDRGQSKPSCDDVMGIGAAYPSSDFSIDRNNLSGTITDGVAGVYGAHVLAISKTRGAVVAGALTDANGDYTIENLEPGEYYLLVEPFAATDIINSLCGGSAAGCGYGSVNAHTVCGGGTTPFEREFIETAPGSGTPQTFTVTAAPAAATAAGTNAVGCVAMVDPVAAASKDSTADNNLIVNAPAADSEVALWATLPAQNNADYHLVTNATGTVKVKVLSYSLYSGFDPQISILDSAGAALSGTTITQNVFSNTSGYVNYDASASFTLSAATDFYIRVLNTGSLSTQFYPGVAGGSGPVSAVNYYLLIVTFDDATTLVPSTASPLLANNARCEATDSFSAYPDLGPGAVSSAGGGSSGSRTASGGCGTISGGSSDGGSGGPGANALFSAWGIAVMLVIARQLRLVAGRLQDLAKRRAPR